MRASWRTLAILGTGLAVLLAGLLLVVTYSDERPRAAISSTSRPRLAAPTPGTREPHVAPPVVASAQIPGGEPRAGDESGRVAEPAEGTRASLYAAYNDPSVSSADRWRAMSLLLQQSGAAQGSWAGEAQAVARSWAASLDIRIVDQGCFKEGCFFFVEYGQGVDTRKLVETMSANPSLDWPNEMLLPGPSVGRSAMGNGAWFLLSPQSNG